jgi:hypothetical protein
MIKFKARMWKTGGSFVITIPVFFIKHGDLDEKKEYTIKIEKVQA